MLSKLLNKGYQAQICELCKTEFNLLKLERIHKCKRCNKHVCWRCGNQKQRVLDEDCKWTPDVHRVCNHCNQELNQINDLVDNRNLAWGRDSDFAKDWLARMNKAMPNRKPKSGKDYEYQHFLKLFLSNMKNFEEQFEIIDKDVIKGRTDFTVFNFSLKQFFFIVQQKSNSDVEKSRLNIANVLYAVAARFDQVGYVQGMSSIAAFLLCYCSQETAYVIFCDLIENILPEKFLVRGNFGQNLIGMLAETHFLKQYFVHIVTEVKGPLIGHDRQPYDQEEIQHLRVIVELSTAKALLSVFVTFLSYRHLSFIWNQLSEHRSFQVAERAFLATLYLRRQELISKRSFKQLETLFEKLQYEEFVQTYYDLDIDVNLKSRLIQDFYETLNKRWSNNSQQNIKQLHRVTNFSEEEIKILQAKFSNSLEVINKEDFVLLVKCYYDILKENQESEAPFLEITSYFVEKLFDSYVTNKHDVKEPRISKDEKSRQSKVSLETPQAVYLDFRQFVCCFSLCTKSLLKQRLCAILNTFRDKNKKISFASFENLIRDLCEISPREIDDKKKEFLNRMNRYFYNQEEGISINELYVLLNDNFINELAMYIRCDAPAIIAKSIAQFQALKQKQRCEASSAQS